MGGLRIKRADALALVGKDDFAVARHRVVAERALIAIACLGDQHALALHQVVFKRALVAVAIQGLAAFAVAQIVLIIALVDIAVGRGAGGNAVELVGNHVADANHAVGAGNFTVGVVGFAVDDVALEDVAIGIAQNVFRLHWGGCGGRRDFAFARRIGTEQRRQTAKHNQPHHRHHTHCYVARLTF